MKKLRLQTQISLDGFCAGPNGEMDWFTWNWDDKLKDYTSKLNTDLDAILLGRKMSDGFITHWDTLNASGQGDAFTQVFTDTRRIIFSHDLKETQHPNAEVRNNLVEDVNALKNEPGNGYLMAYGGADFVTNLIANRLVDEYYFFINPAAIGEGMPIFKTGRDRLALELVESIPFECGIIVSHYRNK